MDSLLNWDVRPATFKLQSQSGWKWILFEGGSLIKGMGLPRWDCLQQTSGEIPAIAEALHKAAHPLNGPGFWVVAKQPKRG